MLERWSILHLVLAVLHTAAGIYVLVGLEDGIQKTEQSVYWSKPEIDDSDGEFHLFLQDNEIFTVSPIGIHGVVSLLTAVSHLIATYIYRKAPYGIQGVKATRPNILRWSEYSITATLMTLSGCISVGQGDIYILTVVTLLGLSLQLCGYYIEKNVKTGTWVQYFYIGVAVEVLIVFPITAWTTATDFGNGGLFAAWVAYSIYYGLFAVNAYWDARYKEDFIKTDKRYVVLSFTSKMALFCGFS